MESHEGEFGTPRLGQSGVALARIKERTDARMLEAFAPQHVVVNTEGDILYGSPLADRYLEPGAGIQRHVSSGSQSGLESGVRAALNDAIDERRRIVRDLRDVEIDGERRPLRVTIEPLLDANDEALYLIVFSPDSSARYAGDPERSSEVLQHLLQNAEVAEEQQRLLVRELNHRVRNMLQVVMGVANQTLHRSSDLQEFETAYFGRMQALARAYELLTREGWQNVPLADLISTQLSAFASDGQRYSATGESVVLTANSALSLGLVFYELATNATKYGALSTSTGHVAISWRVAKSPDTGSENLLLEWVETGGPQVVAPTRQGFGSELVNRQLRYELRGEAVLEYAPSGVIARLRLPADEALDRGRA